ncbi:MAG: energy transducer TonB [Brevundimonas sp.]
MPTPVCPPELRRLRMDGHVRLAYVIGADGRAERGSIRILRSNHDAVLEPAVRLVRLARFEPARRAGQAVRMHNEHRITFQYRGP